METMFKNRGDCTPVSACTIDNNNHHHTETFSKHLSGRKRCHNKRRQSELSHLLIEMLIKFCDRDNCLFK